MGRLRTVPAGCDFGLRAATGKQSPGNYQAY
jgi:hypothetical protein